MMNRKYIGIIMVIIAILAIIAGFYYFNSQNETDIGNIDRISASTSDKNITNNTNKKADDGYIGKDKAISIMKNNSPDEAPGASATLTSFQGKPMYRVSWENGNYAYVDAKTGKVYDKYGSSGGYA